MEEEIPSQPGVRAPRRLNFFVEFVKTAVVVGVLAFAIRFWILQPFIVEGSSMAPGFQTGNYLLIDKISYRLHAPKRGDIIVFKYPNDTSVNYVKRIIGLPGETVKISEGKVVIVNQEHPDGLTLTEPYINGGAPTLLPSGESSAEFKVPADSYFVLGDNRPASSDSRFWGDVPTTDVIGRVILEAWPADQAKLINGAAY